MRFRACPAHLLRGAARFAVLGRHEAEAPGDHTYIKPQTFWINMSSYQLRARIRDRTKGGKKTGPTWSAGF